ncbi:MAG: glycosyltransferase family 4 protein [Moorea sp. SIO1G6]|uniref:glycosyltransferase family 4 protein n=1 Tax=Moorena sp. SIO1G6 TaxID=2607840 RepID=UPI0013BF9EF5|nr:glycosyltransferase family 4 protein [Moorena sp. SIO1G6]NES83002.1 glycosyltransferase family 4 protein [Moorena sp. SIO2B7]NET62926.1 glycosyltransferase family 4 protein [Moorena sp. SIO1G6]
MDKVFFLTGAFPPQTGGELYNYKLSQHLEAVGIPQEYVDLHRRRKYLRLAKIPILGEFLVSLILAMLLYRCQGILVEDHYFSKYLFLTNIIQRFFRKGKIIVLVHLFYGYDSKDGFWLRRFFYSIQEKSRLSFADLIITSSEYSKQEIVSLGINPQSVYVLSPGLDREKFTISPKTEKDTTNKKVLCIANYISRKGLLYLIEAFAQIKRHDFTLHLVGNPKNNSVYYKKMLAFVEKQQMTDCVFFHNGADQENIKQLYSTADIFALPSLKETFGIVLIEAMHYGLPIITTNVSAMPELVQDGENGLLVPPANSQRLAQALSKLMANPELRQDMGQKGRERVNNSYHWEQTSAEFLAIVQQLSNSEKLELQAPTG